MPKIIDDFRGEYAFLSNFYEVTPYRTVEHYYQSEKTVNPDHRGWIITAGTAAESKRRGREIVLRAGWDDMKLSVMRDLLIWKFGFKALAEKLLATGDAELIEGNTWGDTYWGICRGVGSNHLGKLLMDIRGQLAEYQKG